VRRLRDLPGAQDAWHIVLLALIVAAFFWPLLLAGEWIPRGGGDLVSFLWPLYRFAARSLRAGDIPLWNPYLYSGAPFVADNQSSVFYPINLLVFLLYGEPSYAVMELLVVFHIWLAGANMFALGRGLGLHPSAALLGGVAFSLSDVFVTHIGNLNLNATAAWLPLFLLLSHRALTRGSLGRAAGAGVVLAVAALAGHGQMLLFLALILVIYLLYRLAADSRYSWRIRLRTLGLAALIVSVGIAGAALALLPAYEMTAHTVRRHLPYAEATRHSLHPQALIGLLAPGFYGRGLSDFWGSWKRVEVGYAGVLTLVLAAVGAGVWLRNLIISRRAPDATRISPEKLGDAAFPAGFFVLLLPLALFLAMGQFTPLYGLLYRHVPTFDQIRIPARLILLFDLGLAALAAYGLDRLGQGKGKRIALWVGLCALAAAALLLGVGLSQARAVPPPERVWQATTSIAIAATLLGLSGLLVLLAVRDNRLTWLFVPLLAADLIGLGSRLEAEPNDPTWGFRHEDVVAFLRQDPNFFRIEGAAGAWQPDAALVHGLYDIGGIYNPLAVASYQTYRWATGERGAPLYNFLGTKYVLADKGTYPGDERLVPVYTENKHLDVYLNTVALPRALLVHRAQVVADQAAALHAIHAPAFDPARTVVLERGEPLDADPGEGDRRLFFTYYGLNRVELAVRTPVRGYLVLGDVYYPGWQAEVDGVPAEILRANYAFRAVALAPGEHVVKMRFNPWTWRVGLTISLVTWVGLVAWAILKAIRRVR